MRSAFDAAVQRHGPTVLRVCRAVLGPGADADDAWSETFLSALRAWPDLPEDTDDPPGDGGEGGDWFSNLWGNG